MMRSAAYDGGRAEPMTFVWRCDVCGEPIADGDGYICGDRRDAIRRGAEKRREAARRAAAEASASSAVERLEAARVDLVAMIEREEARRLLIPASAIRTFGLASWCAYHDACDPAPERYGYCIEVERCRTLAALLDWNVHLSGKEWVRHTNWPHFLQRQLDRNERRAGIAARPPESTANPE